VLTLFLGVGVAGCKRPSWVSRGLELALLLLMPCSTWNILKEAAPLIGWSQEDQADGADLAGGKLNERAVVVDDIDDLDQRAVPDVVGQLLWVIADSEAQSVDLSPGTPPEARCVAA